MEQYSDFSSEGQFCILLATNEQQMTDPAIMTLQTARLSDIPGMQMQMFAVRELSDPHGPLIIRAIVGSIAPWKQSWHIWNGMNLQYFATLQW